MTIEWSDKSRLPPMFVGGRRPEPTTPEKGGAERSSEFFHTLCYLPGVTWPSGDPRDPNQHPHSTPPPPPPLPYQQAYDQPLDYPDAAPKKSRKGLIIALVVVGVLLLGVLAAAIFVFLATKDKVMATDLAQGDCLTEIPDSALVSLLPKVDCNEPHRGEVYAVLNMPEGEYPGESVIQAWQNRCPEELASYSPAAMADDSVSVFVLYPTQETWDEDDRAITCIATTDDARRGSIEG